MPSITPLPTAPHRNQGAAAFVQNANATMAALPVFQSEMNALAASLNALAAGGAYAIPIVFSGTTTDADPGTGFMRLSSTTQNASTVLRIDVVGTDNVNYTSILDTFDDSTNSVKGSIRIVKIDDATKFLDFNVTSVASPTGYRNIAVTSIGGSSSNPFVNGDSLMLFFQRAGDKGDTGPTYSFPVLHLREEQAAGVDHTIPVSISAGIWRRVLNSVKANTISGASMASNQFVLPAGTYKFQAKGQTTFGTGSAGIIYWHKMALYNVTDATYVSIGLNATSHDRSTNGSYVGAPSEIVGQFTIAAGKTFELRHLCPQANPQSAAAGVNGGQVEVYTDIFVEKVS